MFYLSTLHILSQFIKLNKKTKMTSSPIIDLDTWNVEETKISVMKGSTSKNCAVTNSVTKKIIEIKTSAFISKYGIDDKYGDLKIKINVGEISFEKFIQFDNYVMNLDKFTFLEKKKKDQEYTPLICNESSMNFHINIDKVVVIGKENKIVDFELSIDNLKNLVRNSKIICFIKFDYLYNTCGKYGIKKSVTKIQILE